MKKTICSLLFLAGSGVIAQAQTIIPRAGLVVAHNSMEDSEDGVSAKNKAITGFTIGAGYNFPLVKTGGNVFSLQPELVFIQKGLKSEFSATFSFDDEEVYGIKVKSKLIINYLEIPVLAKFEFGRENARFFVAAGPSLSYGMGGKDKVSFTIADGQVTYSDSYTGKVKFGDEPDDNEEDVYFDNRLDVGAQFGAGVTIAQKVTIDIRYGLGFTDLVDDVSSKNRAFQFSVGVPLALK